MNPLPKDDTAAPHPSPGDELAAAKVEAAAAVRALWLAQDSAPDKYADRAAVAAEAMNHLSSLAALDARRRRK